jgi:murein DD-endopeptidase MepM/ murein hydrolase activator NlpD
LAATAATLALTLCLALSVAGPQSPPARAATIEQLQRQVAAGQGRVSGLAGAVGADDNRLGQLRAGVATLQHEISVIQANLDAKLAQLAKLRTLLSAAKARLAKAEAVEQHAEGLLASSLVASYENDRPDLISVVVDSSGFQNLLEQISFQQRIRRQDMTIVAQVRAARRAVAAQAIRLGAIEARQQALTDQVLAQRDRLTATKVRLVEQQLSVARSRAAKAGQLASERRRLSVLQGQLQHLQATQAAPTSAGGFTFPLPPGAVVGPGDWTPDDGVDMAAPGGTPEFAVCSGTIVLHGIGGFGPWAPVLHCDRPVGGYSFVYYGHAGPAHQLPVGTRVSAGQMMSEVGPGIVGFSTGPHIEIGFSDSSGNPIGPSSAGAMMALLRRSY